MNLKSSAPKRPQEISFFISRLVEARGPSADSAAKTSLLYASGLKSEDDGAVFRSEGCPRRAFAKGTNTALKRLRNWPCTDSGKMNKAQKSEMAVWNAIGTTTDSPDFRDNLISGILCTYSSKRAHQIIRIRVECTSGERSI